MESVNGNDINRLRFLYLIGLLVDPILFILYGAYDVYHVLMIFFSTSCIDCSVDFFLITHLITTFITYGVGWIGYCTQWICPVVIYGAGLFVQNVYVLLSIVESRAILSLIVLSIHLYFSIFVLRYAYALIAKKRQMSDVERNDEAHSMEHVNVNNDTDLLLRFLYVIGLSVDLVTSVYLGLILTFGSSDIFRITLVVIAVAIDAIGWTGYFTQWIRPVVMYSIASFAQNVYVLVSFVRWRENLSLTMSFIRVYFSILTLGYAYTLITKKRRMSHVERNDEAHSIEPVNINNEATH